MQSGFDCCRIVRSKVQRRIKQYTELEQVIINDVKAIILTGPISSGKSYTLEQICLHLKETHKF